jgi:hypothetical protein
MTGALSNRGAKGNGNHEKECQEEDRQAVSEKEGRQEVDQALDEEEDRQEGQKVSFSRAFS